MAYDIEIRTLQTQPTATIRVTTTPAEVGATLGEVLPTVWGFLEGRGVHPAGPPFARYHDSSAGQVDLEAGLPLTTPVAGEGRIAAGELPGGRVAVTWHVGPYEDLPNAHHAIIDWLTAGGHEAGGVPWEVYWTDPSEVPDPAAWRTEVFHPIR